MVNYSCLRTYILYTICNDDDENDSEDQYHMHMYMLSIMDNGQWIMDG